MTKKPSLILWVGALLLLVFAGQFFATPLTYAQEITSTLSLDQVDSVSTASEYLELAQPRILFVDNQNPSSEATKGDGSLITPFQQLDDALLAADLECDIIFLFASPKPYNIDHAELLDCQKLIGQDYAPYSIEQLSGFNIPAPAATVNNRPTIHCSQTIDYLTGVNPSLYFPTTNQGCIELAKNNIVAGINIDNPNSIQKGIAGNNVESFWGYNISAPNSDGFSFSCNDTSNHKVKLTDNIRIENYGYIGIDIVSFASAEPGDCSLNADLANVTIVDAASGGQEAIFAVSQANTQLSLKINHFKASNITESVVRITSLYSSNASLNLTNASITNFDMVGVYAENYVFWPQADQALGLAAQVSQSIFEPNANGRGILVNSQGNTASYLNFNHNTIGRAGVRSDGVYVYGNNSGAINAVISDNVFLSRGTSNPNLPSSQTHTAHMPIYFESNMDQAIGCLTATGNNAPAGYNHAYGLETASLGIKAGINSEVRLSEWSEQGGQPKALEFVQNNNPSLVGGSKITINNGGVLSGGTCPTINEMIKPNLIISDLVVTEDSGVATVTVELSEFSNQDIQVDFTTASGTALDSTDYIGINGEAVFPAGTISQTIEIAIIDDVLQEENETFYVDFSSANESLTISDPQIEITILANDAVIITPTLLVSDVMTTEDSGLATVSLELSEPSNQEIIALYALTPGTANPESDYNSVSGQVSFAPGTTSASFDIEIIDDALVEPDETFHINLTAGSGINLDIPDPQITVTIQSDDIAIIPNMSAADVIASEGDGNAIVQVLLDEPAGQDILINYQAFDGSAASPDDFTASSGTLAILEGSQTGTFEFEIADDQLNELNEYFLVQLTTADPTLVTIKNPELAVTIIDNDDILIIAGNSNGEAVRIVEDEGIALVDISLNRASTTEIQVTIATQNLLAISGEDYTAVPLTTLTFAPGQLRQTVSINIIDDTITAEGLEKFRVNVSSTDALIYGNAFTEIVIVDNDNVLPWLYFEFADYSIYEDMDNDPESASELEVTLKLSNPAATDVTVTVQSNNGTATTPDDYQALNEVVVIPAGQREATIIVKVNEDGVVERQQTFSIVFATLPTGALADPTQNSTTVTIADGTPPVLRVSTTATTENTTSGRQAVVQLTFEGNVVLPVRFGFQIQLDVTDRSNSNQGIRTYQLGPGTSSFDITLPLDTIRNVASSEDAELMFLVEILKTEGASSDTIANYVKLISEHQSQPYTLYLPMVAVAP